ncbi:30S ribosomal protein S5 [Candidatus Woesearchaeota archaeon]|nr:30S ribosomal protein S5 [Candidatus Woesearchaeota archaeon]
MRKEKLPEFDPAEWKPKTELGLKVKSKEITQIDEILDRGDRILEPEIVDMLMPTMEAEFLLIGQAKGKFGGGQRRMFRNTQKKTKEGNKPKFTAMAVIGDRNGHIGIGTGSSKETVPSREKALRQAKLNVFKIRRGIGSWDDQAETPHSIPFAVEGKCGSVIVRLMPAPKGKGLVVEKESAKVLALSGIKNVWSKTLGMTKTKMNMLKALEKALRQLSEIKVADKYKDSLLIMEGGKQREDKTVLTPEEIQEEAKK